MCLSLLLLQLAGVEKLVRPPLYHSTSTDNKTNCNYNSWDNLTGLRKITQILQEY